MKYYHAKWGTIDTLRHLAPNSGSTLSVRLYTLWMGRSNHKVESIKCEFIIIILIIIGFEIGGLTTHELTIPSRILTAARIIYVLRELHLIVSFCFLSASSKNKEASLPISAWPRSQFLCVWNSCLSSVP